MPFSVKSPAERLRRREENGLRVKGTGVGQRVKGKEDERQLKARCVVILREKGRLRRRSWGGILGDGLLTEKQTREEETGYVGDATDDPDLEGGNNKPLSYAHVETDTNQHNREDMDVDGRSGQNKRLAHKNWKRNCTTGHQHRIKGVHSNSREDGVILGSKLWLDVYSTNRRLCDHECVSIVKLWM